MTTGTGPGTITLGDASLSLCLASELIHKIASNNGCALLELRCLTRRNSVRVASRASDKVVKATC